MNDKTKKLLQYTFLVVFFFGIFPVLVARERGCPTSMRNTMYPAVAVALEIELNPFLNMAQEESVCIEDGIEYRLMSHKGKKFLLYTSGVGSPVAYENTLKTLDTFSVQMILISGIGASSYEALAVGDTVVAEAWRDIATGETVPVDAVLLKRISDEDDVTVVPFGGTANTFIKDQTTIPVNIGIIDMETYAIALAAKQNNVPFIAFRTVSDRADGNESYEDFIDAAKINTAKVLAFLAVSEITTPID